MRVVGTAAASPVSAPRVLSTADLFIDAMNPSGYKQFGFVSLTGSNYLHLPDSNALDISSDIDIRIKIAMFDWTPVVFQSLLSKAGNNNSYHVGLQTTGALFIEVGGGGYQGYTSTSSVGFTDGAVKWVRATWKANNGSSQSEARFYTSDDGVSWTQLGNAVTSAIRTLGTNSNELRIGAFTTTGNASAVGNFYAAQIYNGIDGTKVLDIDIARDFNDRELDSFVALTGQTVGIRAHNFVQNLGKDAATYHGSIANVPHLSHNGTNYVYIPATSQNFIRIPDHSSFRITGDLDIRVRVAYDSWTPSNTSTIIAKHSSTAGNYSYAFYLLSNGSLNLTFSADGTTLLSRESTVPTSLGDKEESWVRVVLDVNNGASGHDVKFYLSKDGVTWTQLGATITNSGTTSIYAGTEGVSIGALTYFGNSTFAGAFKFYRAQILNGIDGTAVLDLDATTLSDSLTKLIVPTVGPTFTGAYFTGTGLSFPDLTYNYAYAKADTNLAITGDIDIQAKIAMNDWTPFEDKAIVSKRLTDQSTDSTFDFGVASNGTLYIIIWSTVFTGNSYRSHYSSVAVGATDGAYKWVRVTVDVDNGAGQYDVKFYTSDDGISWTQLGTTRTGNSGVISLPLAGYTNLQISGNRSQYNRLSATLDRLIIKNGIDGTVAFDADFTTVPANSSYMIESSANKAIVRLVTTRYPEIYESSSTVRRIVVVTKPKFLFGGINPFIQKRNAYLAYYGEPYLWLPGAARNYASTPSTSPLSVTGDLDVRLKVGDIWSITGISYAFVGKWLTTGNQRSWRLFLTGTTNLSFEWTTNGLSTSSTVVTSTATITQGVVQWIRATLDVDNGAGQNEVKFYTSADGISWSQLGSTIVTSGVTSVFAGTAALEIGSFDGGTSNPISGQFYRVQLLRGIDGELVFDANFQETMKSVNQNTITEWSKYRATVTINSFGTSRPAGVLNEGILTETLPFNNISIIPYGREHLTFGSSTPFSLVAIHRSKGDTTNANFITKRSDSGGANKGYQLRYSGNSVSYYRTSLTLSGDTNVGLTSPKFENVNEIKISAATVDRAGNKAVIYVDGENTLEGTPPSGSIDANDTHFFFIGREARFSGQAYSNMELIAVAVFSRVLSPSELQQIATYYKQREVI